MVKGFVHSLNGRESIESIILFLHSSIKSDFLNSFSFTGAIYTERESDRYRIVKCREEPDELLIKCDGMFCQIVNAHSLYVSTHENIAIGTGTLSAAKIQNTKQT